ncbi:MULTISPECIES: DUF3993 domain-containing protein [Metabacillus]|uniref:DUF3993 domain-containing protein n=2 Tax=Metabacillus TaxID=2675233 RepID=A0A179SYD8_9BACI|nr:MULTISPECIES: DUF3993 domain-containing protein [Metabacillus]OAS86635.1 hypothetical protein A6K24_03740 [Metabacillus litoralis]QNF29292.1 DUF3993 domain-containing protein [Metabacillus sp. KUDC1714]
MRLNRLLCCIVLFIGIFPFSQQTLAEKLEGSSRDEVLIYLQNAFDAQISLTEKIRSKQEIEQILSTYFEDELIEKYINENVHPLDGQFIVYGTDFPIYTIPFFTYGVKTKVIEQGDERIIYEFFPASIEGPVGYDDHYEVVKMHKTNEGWKIYSIENETNEPVLIEDQKTPIDDKVENDVIQTTSTEHQLRNKNTSNQLKILNQFDIENTVTFFNQYIKELKSISFFSWYYMQTKNVSNEYKMMENDEFSSSF